MPRREALAVGLAAFVLVVVLPLCNALPADGPVLRLELHAEPLRQVPRLRDPRAGPRSPVGLRRRSLARPRGVLRPRRVRDGHAPHARDRRQERVPERPARLHGVEPGQGAAALLAGRFRAARSRSPPSCSSPGSSAWRSGISRFAAGSAACTSRSSRRRWRSACGSCSTATR